MSEKTTESKTEYNEADSAVLSDTILESQLAELRAKVKGKFLRLTLKDEQVPFFVRCEHISAYSDIWKDSALGFKQFEGCWVRGANFGALLKENAEDIQALIAQAEGEYSNDELADLLIALLICGGTDADEARALLSTPGGLSQQKLGNKLVELGERLIQTTPSRHGEKYAQHIEKKWLDAQASLSALIEAGEELAEALGKSARFDGAADPVAETVFVMKTARSRLQSATPDQTPATMDAPVWLQLIQAGEKLYLALGGESTDTFYDDPGAVTVRCIEQAISRVQGATSEKELYQLRQERSQLSAENVGIAKHSEISGRLLTEALEKLTRCEQRCQSLIEANESLRGELRRQREQLTRACDQVLAAVGILKEDPAVLGRDELSQTLLNLRVAVERIEELKAACRKIFEVLSLPESEGAETGIRAIVRMLEQAAVCIADDRADKVMAQSGLLNAALNLKSPSDPTLPPGAEELGMQEAVKFFRAIGMSDADLLREEREAGHPLIACGRMFAKAAERLETLTQEAATNLQTSDELSRKVSELEARLEQQKRTLEAERQIIRASQDLENAQQREIDDLRRRLSQALEARS